MAKGEDETMDPGRPAPIGKEKEKPSSNIGQPIRPEAPEALEAPAPQATIPAMKGVSHRESGDDEPRQDGAIAKD